MRQSVLLLGAGGHAKVLVEALRAQAVPIAGLLDRDPAKAGNLILGVRVLGDDTLVQRYSPAEIELVNALGSVGVTAARQELFERYTALGYRFATVVHPSAILASDVKLCQGAQVMAGVVMQPGCRIGANSIVNTRASLDHDCIVGAHAHIAPGVTLSGGVRVGNRAHLGTAATVIQGICIGDDCLVAAGAVVVRHLEKGRKARGTPAKEFE